MKNCQLLIDYVYLDSEERKRFAQASHEYLIEQLQYTGSETLTSVSNKYRLNFNHPSKYLIWVPHLANYNTQTKWAVHALAQGSWKDSYELMAKLVALAGSNAQCSETATNQMYQVTVQVKSATDASPTVAGLFELNFLTTPLKQTLDTMWDRVSVSARGYDDVGPTNDNVWNVTIGQGSSAAAALTDALSNCIVTDNSLTAADLSWPFDLLTSSTSTNLLSTYQDQGRTVTVLDQFNSGNFIDGTDNPVIQAKIQLNGHDRFQMLDGNYFNYVQPYQHFSNTPADGINVYSFALKAEDHQPTGTCNFSRIDNATLQVDVGLENSWASASALLAPGQGNAIYNTNYLGSTSVLKIYTVNYNVLRVMSGMAGTAYSN